MTETLPAEERFALAVQLRRAAVSVPSNLAEGGARRSDADFRRYVDMAYGSLMEVETQLLLAQDLRFIDKATSTKLLSLTYEVGKMLNGLGHRLKTAPPGRKR